MTKCASCGRNTRSENNEKLPINGDKYCAECCDVQGILLPFSEVLENFANYFMNTLGYDIGVSRNAAMEILKRQPAWEPMFKKEEKNMVGRKKSLALFATSIFLVGLIAFLSWYYSYDHLPKISIVGTNLVVSTEYLPGIHKRAKTIESINGVDLSGIDEVSSSIVLKSSDNFYYLDMQNLNVNKIGNTKSTYSIKGNKQRFAKQSTMNINGKITKHLELIDFAKDEKKVIALDAKTDHDFSLSNNYLLYTDKPSLFAPVKYLGKKDGTYSIIEERANPCHNLYCYNPSTETTFVITEDKYQFLNYIIIGNIVYWFAHREGSMYSWDTTLYDFRKTDLETRKTVEWKLPDEVKIFLLKTGKFEFDGRYIVYEGFYPGKHCFGLGLYAYNTETDNTIPLTSKYIHEHGENNFTGHISRSYRLAKDDKSNKTYVFWNELIKNDNKSFLDVAYKEISDSYDAQIKYLFDPSTIDRDYTLDAVFENRIAIRSFYYQLPSTPINPQMELWLVDVSNLKPKLITRKDKLVFTSCMLNKDYLVWSEDDYYFTIDKPSYVVSGNQKHQYDLSWKKRDNKYKKVVFLDLD